MVCGCGCIVCVRVEYLVSLMLSAGLCREQCQLNVQWVAKPGDGIAWCSGCR